MTRKEFKLPDLTGQFPGNIEPKIIDPRNRCFKCQIDWGEPVKLDENGSCDCEEKLERFIHNLKKVLQEEK